MTKVDIIKALQENQALEMEQDGFARYYIHIDENGNLVPFVGNAEITISTPAAYVDKLWNDCVERASAETEDEQTVKEIACDEFWGTVYDLETEDNADFMEVVDDLYEQALEAIKSLD